MGALGGMMFGTSASSCCAGSASIACPAVGARVTSVGSSDVWLAGVIGKLGEGGVAEMPTCAGDVCALGGLGLVGVI